MPVHDHIYDTGGMVVNARNTADAHNIQGDGTTDDTAAINDFLAGLQQTVSYRGTVRTTSVIGFFPEGVYKCNGGITIPYGVNIMGVPGRTIFDFENLPAAGKAMTVGSPAPTPEYIGDVTKVQGIALRGPGSASDSVGIFLGGTNDKVAQTEFSELSVGDFGVGVEVGDNAFLLRWNHSEFNGNGIGYRDTGSLSLSGENMVFSFCVFSHNDMHYDITPTAGGGVGYTFNECSFDYARATPEARIGGAKFLRYRDCHFETNQAGTAGNALLIDITYPVGALVFDGCWFACTVAVTGIPIRWNTATAGSPPLFVKCRVQNDPLNFFYPASGYESVIPNALVIDSDEITVYGDNVIRVNGTGVKLPNSPFLESYLATTTGLNFGAVAPGAIATVDVPVSGARVGNAVGVSWGTGGPPSDYLSIDGYVSAADTVRLVVRNNHPSTTFDPSLQDYTITVPQFDQ